MIARSQIERFVVAVLSLSSFLITCSLVEETAGQEGESSSKFITEAARLSPSLLSSGALGSASVAFKGLFYFLLSVCTQLGEQEQFEDEGVVFVLYFAGVWMND